jgi:hypothetical protein
MDNDIPLWLYSAHFAIIDNGDNTFDVSAKLRLQRRGASEVIVEGLTRTTFPPFEGELRQP